MSVTYTLAAGATSVTLNPTWSYKHERTMDRSDHRMIDQTLVSYKWAAFDVLDLPVDFVSPADAAQINAWWQAGTALTLTISRDGADTVITGKLTGSTTPVPTFQFPRTDYYKGKLGFEASAAL